MIKIYSHEYFMKEALKEAKKALAEDEVPIGAVVVCKNRIISRGYNQVEKLKDATAHAEMIAITSAAAGISSKYLSECTLYVTIEPCVMCAGAIHWSHLARVVYGANDPKKGYSVYNTDILHKNIEVVPKILEDECTEIIQSFFQSKR